jgi:hypothetical protein
MVGRVISATSFNPKFAMLLQNKDLVILVPGDEHPNSSTSVSLLHSSNMFQSLFTCFQPDEFCGEYMLKLTRNFT